jgi:hypothetical protein
LVFVVLGIELGPYTFEVSTLPLSYTQPFTVLISISLLMSDLEHFSIYLTLLVF